MLGARVRDEPEQRRFRPLDRDDPRRVAGRHQHHDRPHRQRPREGTRRGRGVGGAQSGEIGTGEFDLTLSRESRTAAANIGLHVVAHAENCQLVPEQPLGLRFNGRLGRFVEREADAPDQPPRFSVWIIDSGHNQRDGGATDKSHARHAWLRYRPRSIRRGAAVLTLDHETTRLSRFRSSSPRWDEFRRQPLQPRTRDACGERASAAGGSVSALSVAQR